MSKGTKISILIPCYNEEESIGSVVDAFKAVEKKSKGYCFDIIVIDNNSKDKTTEVAKAHGATVFFEPKKGKGNAMRSGFLHLAGDTDFVIMIDGDDTYRPNEIMRLIEPLESGFCTVVLGSRLCGKINRDSMKLFNLLGNKFFTFFTRQFYKVQATDVLTGYYAWKVAAVRTMVPHLTSEGFAIEIEMVTKMAKLGEEIFSVPVTYAARVGESSLHPLVDGVKIMRVLLGNLFWSPVKTNNKTIMPDRDSGSV
jgi:glycosyltransferase involved in cell wall biosynthesis